MSDVGGTEGGFSRSPELSAAMTDAAILSSVSTDGRAKVYFSNHPSVADPKIGKYAVFRGDSHLDRQLEGEGWTLLYVVHRPDRAE
jgi:hypothetical protein